MEKKKNRPPMVLMDYDAQRYCFNKGYRVYPVTKDNIRFNIEVSIDDESRLLDEVYNEKTIHKGIADTYLRIYNK